MKKIRLWLLELRWWWVDVRCEYFGHKPDREKSHYRVRREVGEEYAEDYEREHYERYTNCTRCGCEIKYIRFVNVWLSEEEVSDRNCGRWFHRDEVDMVREDIWLK